jgi:hypothetical protein
MLFRTAHVLAGGTRVRLRYPQASDRPGLLALAERVGMPLCELELQRLVGFDPRKRRVVCASGWIAGSPVLVGFAVADLDPGASVDVLLADEELAPGIEALLLAALADRGRAGRQVA